MPVSDTEFWVALLQIIWIDALLSGDNAIVIALACRRLPAHQRRMGIIFGTGVAILLRIIFAIFVAKLLGVPYLKLIGAVLLVWIAIKLIVPEDEELSEDNVTGSGTLFGAIQTIVIADAVMSFDNVVGIGAAAKGSAMLIVIGLLLSIPLIMWGSTLILRLLDRYPLIIILGGGLLGYLAGDIAYTDPVIAPLTQALPAWVHWAVKIGGVILALAVGLTLRRRKIDNQRKGAA
ncbi:MAG: YjbE family putative metal transport protein [Gammaproteobacteria bacterium]|nr:YjbE family putative metal transport protein [Gammaproteobacteria bacterium]